MAGEKQFRLSFDDNIWLFKDIAQGSYGSIFENAYLKLLQSLHTDFAVKIHLNIYYQTQGFCLAEMSDVYKSEWEENADWLQLSFHSLQDEPSFPYKDANYEQVKRDCALIQGEILRFAGEKTLSKSITLHYCTAKKEGCAALYNCGVRNLIGLFNDGLTYHLPPAVSEHLAHNAYYDDVETGLRFFTNDIVLNNFTTEKILHLLQEKSEKRFLEIMIHEQYFHRHYAYYQPDFEDKLRLALKWMADKGYRSIFLEEIA